MGTGSIIGYVVTFIILFLSINTIPQSIVYVLTRRIVGAFSAGIIGGIVTWTLIDCLWLVFWGGRIPIAALVASLIFVSIHRVVSDKDLTEASKFFIKTEIWAIVLFSAFLCLFSSPIRLY